MKQIAYSGIEGEAIVITQPTDIYPLLDWCQSRMMDKEDEAKGTVNKAKWKKAVMYLNDLMEQVERDGFGSHDDIDNIKYS